MPMYKVICCDGRTKPGRHSVNADFVPGCGWVLECNGIGVGLSKCGSCGGGLRFAQSKDPQDLVDWLADRKLEIPRWLTNSVPVG